MSKSIVTKIETINCVFVSRLNRFVGLVRIRGEETPVHITNTGRLSEYLAKGKECKVIKINAKKLNYRLIAVKDRNAYAIIDTRLQSRVFELAIQNSILCFMKNCKISAKEPKAPEGRFDYLIRCSNDEILVETKSAVLRGPRDEAMYPDCPTDRGVRHVKQLIKLFENGSRVAIIFTAALPGPRCFKPYREGDPRLYKVLTEALRRRLPIHAYSTFMEENGNIIIEKPCLPLCPEWLEEAYSDRI